MIAQDLVQHFRQFGYAITPVLIEESALAEVRGVFERILAEADAKTYTVRNTLFPAGLHRLYPEMARFLRHPALLGLAKQLVGDEVDQTWNQAIIKPGITGGHFSWHQDGRYAITEPLDAGFTLWIAITDTTIANGTLWVAPSYWGRGLMPHIRDNTHYEWQCQFDGKPEPVCKMPVELKAGQMLIFSRLMPHASGPNTTDAPRMAYQVGFGRPGAVLGETQKPFGDQVPVFRRGQLVPA